MKQKKQKILIFWALSKPLFNIIMTLFGNFGLKTNFTISHLFKFFKKNIFKKYFKSLICESSMIFILNKLFILWIFQ